MVRRSKAGTTWERDGRTLTVWGTFMLDAYRTDERREVAAALEDLFSPISGTGWEVIVLSEALSKDALNQIR